MLAARTMDDVRQRRLLELRARKFVVEPDADGRASVVRDAAGGHARVESRGLRARITSAEGRVLETEQYANGRMREITDASGRRVRFGRDRSGLLQSIDRGPEGGIFKFELSQDWQPLRVEYPDGAVARAEYSPSGEPTSITNRDGTEIRYGYSPDGKLASITDPKNQRTQISYEGPGDSRVIEYPNGDRHEYRHEIQANVLRHYVNGEPHAQYTRNFETDELDITYHDGTSEHFRFQNGRIVEARNEYATVQLQYDDAGRLTAEEIDGDVVSYLRNEVGSLTAIKTPTGNTLSFERDLDQRLTGVVDWVGGRYAISLPPCGPVTQIAFPNGMAIEMASTAMGLPASWSLARVSNPRNPLDTASWEYDLCDRVVSAARNGRRQAYRYDKAGQLAEVLREDGTRIEQFERDATGNRIHSDGAPCTYDAMNRLLGQGRREYSYDRFGNQTAVRMDGDVSSYRFNGRGQLIELVNRGGITRYGYDALGRRIFKQSGNLTMRFRWAGTQLLSESTDDGHSVTRRDYLVCPEFLNPLAFREHQSVYYIHCGRRQEPLCVTDAGGELVWKADYLGFGRAFASVERVRQPLRLPGQYFDEESGLHYSGARYLDPDLGRFLSVDPLRLPGARLNYYNYADGDPLNRLDPTGEISLALGTVLAAIAVGVVVGAAVGAGVELYKQRNQEKTDWSQVGYSALIGGCLGGIGMAVFVVAEAATVAAVGVVAAGAIAGGLSAAAEFCVDAIGKREWNWEHFGISVAAGAAAGAATAGIGGIAAARAARRAAQEAAEKELAERLAKEAEERALREARERAAAEAAAKAAAKDPKALGKAIGQSVKAQSTGKTASICKKVSELPLSPAEKAAAAEAAAQEAFGQTGGVVKAGEDFVVLPNMPPGPGRPIIGVHPDGTAFQGTADVVLDQSTTPWALKATNVVER
jgi:RHS repeat-associated protein